MPPARPGSLTGPVALSPAGRLASRTRSGGVGMSRVTLIGGHGKVALLAARLLVGDGHEVTSVVRNPDHVADVEATGATAAVVDVEHAGTEELAEALRGSELVVWSAGAGGGNPARTYAVDRDAAIRSME